MELDKKIKEKNREYYNRKDKRGKGSCQKEVTRGNNKKRKIRKLYKKNNKLKKLREIQRKWKI